MISCVKQCSLSEMLESITDTVQNATQDTTEAIATAPTGMVGDTTPAVKAMANDVISVLTSTTG